MWACRAASGVNVVWFRLGFEGAEGGLGELCAGWWIHGGWIGEGRGVHSLSIPIPRCLAEGVGRQGIGIDKPCLWMEDG